ncbi:vacuolar protein sorting-associated protein 54 [Orycteropus afer afer]|uniref:Vacuolar protein sorting-associated protein 54 n=1 Tax=Orycteropus afer afer TaxID=1230840 RepID=A0AC54ZC77_ORYAF|nr:vacuolar protein sorting-associated protein 54 [Orycteropus afer afer]
MASSHSSSPVPQGSSSDVFFKKEVDPTKHIRTVQSLPDVCPKEPTGDTNSLCVAPSLVTDQHRWTIYHSKVNLPAALNDPRLAKRESDFFTKTWGLDFVDTEVIPSFYLPQISKEHFTVYQQEISQSALYITGSVSVDLINRKSKILKKQLSGRSNPSKAQREHKMLFTYHLYCFRHLGSQLCELEKLIDKMMIAEFSTYSHSDLNRPLEDDCQILEEERLVSLVFGLLKQRKLNFLEIYGEEMIITAKNIIKQCVINKVSQIEEIDADVVMKHLGSQLCELEKLIDKMMIAEFSTYSHSDLNRPLEDDCQILEEERLVSLVFGLLKQRKLNFLEIYGEEMIITAKNIIKQCVINKVSQIEEIDADVVMKIQATLNIIHSVVLSVLDKNQRTRELEEVSQQKNASKDNSLDTEVAYLIHEGMFISDAFSEGELTSVAVDSTSHRNASPNSEPCSSDSVSEPECTTDSSSSKEQTSSSITPGGVDMMGNEDMKLTDLELGKLANSIQELLYSASDICHDRAVKFLMSRAKDGFLEKLNSTEFITLSRLMETFILDTEQICGRKSMSLLGALQSQANKFVNRFHEERKTKLSLLLDNERWKQADVPAEFQDLVDSISDGKIALPEKKSGATEERKPAEVLIVEGQQYAVVGTVLLLIRIILEYCQCVDNIPSVTTDMLTRLSDLLKYFNSRSCQLVLGAGALQVVGLKTITTKNLALSSRCLQLIVHYIPVIRAHFEARLQPKQYSMLRHFDHITKDYHDHIAEISAKLVAIMDSLFDKLLSKMLFLRINASYKLHLKKQLSHLNVINDGGPQNGLVTADVAFYTGNLQALKGLKDLDLNMAEIWEQKR